MHDLWAELLADNPNLLRGVEVLQTEPTKKPTRALYGSTIQHCIAVSGGFKQVPGEQCKSPAAESCAPAYKSVRCAGVSWKVLLEHLLSTNPGRILVQLRMTTHGWVSKDYRNDKGLTDAEHDALRLDAIRSDIPSVPLIYAHAGQKCLPERAGERCAERPYETDEEPYAYGVLNCGS